MGVLSTRSLLIFFVLSFVFFAANFSSARALGAVANAMCNPWYAQCGCNMVPFGKNGSCIAGKNTNQCPPGVCIDTTSGFTTMGVCPIANKCEGKTGGDMGGIQQALGMTQQILGIIQGIKGLLGGGAGGGGGEGGGMLALPGGCISGYYNTTSPSSTDPCAMYVPSGLSDYLNSGSSGISDSLLDALGGGNPAPSVSETLINQIPNPTTPTPTPTQTQQQPGSVFTSTTTGTLTGSVKITEAGASVVAGIREGITVVGGFFGGNTFSGSTSQSVASRICASRPWAGGSLLASIIPDVIFDGACSKAGYQVGIAAVQQGGSGAVIQVQTTPRPVVMPTPIPQTAPPTADIWAEPSSVRLGTRTYVFWNAKNVASCAVSGPNFAQATLSGGASTVPLSGATTYTIDCTAFDGSKVSDTVTVTLAI